jgi:hypothetical protein
MTEHFLLLQSNNIITDIDFTYILTRIRTCNQLAIKHHNIPVQYYNWNYAIKQRLKNDDMEWLPLLSGICLVYE